jgi:hypothetical protein
MFFIVSHTYLITNYNSVINIEWGKCPTSKFLEKNTQIIPNTELFSRVPCSGAGSKPAI